MRAETPNVANAMSLTEYHKKREFDLTLESAGNLKHGRGNCFAVP
jgi:hypothetical protein